MMYPRDACVLCDQLFGKNKKHYYGETSHTTSMLQTNLFSPTNRVRSNAQITYTHHTSHSP